MAHQPAYERFEAAGPDGRRHTVHFIKAGFLAKGDRPELFFFRVDGEEIVVGISGGALERWQCGRRYFSREEKIDLAGLLLKRKIEAGAPLGMESLYIQDEGLARLAGDLGLSS